MQEEDLHKLPGIIDGLLETWDSRSQGGVRQAKPRSGRTRTPGQIAVVLALTTHVHSIVRGLRHRLPDELTIVDMPLVRAAYETTIRLLWMDHVEGAAEAWNNHDVHQRRLLRDAMDQTTSLRSLSSQIANTEREELAAAASTAREAKFVEQATKRLAIDGAYAYYRILCQLTHPSALVAESYLDASENYAFTHIPTPRPLGSSVSWTWLLATCLVWSGRAVDYTDGNRRRSELRSAARALGTKAEVGLLPPQ